MSPIHSGELAGAQVPLLLSRLDSLMPYSIPMVGRIQFHLDQPVSKTARIFIAVASGDVNDDGVGTSGWLDGWLSSAHDVGLPAGSETKTTPTTLSPPSSQPWIAAHIDLVSYGQTQVWLFASWEHPSHSVRLSACHPDHSFDSDSNSAPVTTCVHTSLMTCLFAHISRHLVPEMPTSPPPDWLTLKRTGKYLTTPFSRDKVLFGTVNETLSRWFPDRARARTAPSHCKYIFSPETLRGALDVERGPTGSAIPANPVPLPEGYRFASMREQDLQVVLDRTQVPRTLDTMRPLVSVGLFHSSAAEPIGWGFLNKDGSIASLHTEPAHRGQGLAVALSRELLWQRARQRGGEPSWAHADVAHSNRASRRVMEKLGGRVMWTVMWTEVHLERALEALEAEGEGREVKRTW